MYFLAMFGWKSGDSRKRRKNSYTSCGHKDTAVGSGLVLKEVLWVAQGHQVTYLKVRPGCLQRRLVLLRVKLGSSGVGGRRESTEHVDRKLGQQTAE